MARAGGKRPTKSGTPTSTPAKPTSTSHHATSDGSDGSIPDPFRPLSPSLLSFASTLPTDHVYAVHIDPHPITLKKRVFVVPVLLNLVLTAALAVRVYYAVPTYLQMLLTTLGYDTPWTVRPQQMAAGDILGEISSRTMFLMMDYCLFAFLGRWPWEFVMGDRKYGRATGPVEWRRILGFQPKEIVVRKGRKWDGALTGLDVDKGKEAQRIRDGKPGKSWLKEEELTVQMKLEQALRRMYTEKTGYLLLDREWDLDFRAMIDAHDLVEKNKLKMSDLDHVALVNVAGQWGMWYPHGEEQINGNAAKVDNVEEDKRLQNFKEKLTEMKCEGVFFRWIEMVQYETSQPGGFTEAKKAEAVSELRRMIKDRGKDDKDLWQAIGGLKGVPGLEESD